MVKKGFYILLLIVIATACFNLNRISLYNLSNQYSNTLFTRLEAVVYNEGPNNARIYVPVILSDMVTKLDTSSGKAYKKVGITYVLFETYESKQILDSATLLLVDSSLQLADSKVSVKIDFPARERYILKLAITDLNRIDDVQTFLDVNNTSQLTHNNFLLTDALGDIRFSPSITYNDEFRLHYSVKNKSQLFVRYYSRDFPLALPPFIEQTENSFDYNADSIFKLALVGGESELITFSDEGFYFCQADSSEREGYTIFRFYEGFPEIVSAQQMLQPLRYITTKKEYDELLETDDLKLAVDNFWIETAGNPTRARAMIKKYYSRVVDANNYFSSYLEGWKTDRGLIYLVYGPPRIVYRGDGIEEWLYGEKGNSNSIRFKFVKVENPFTENDYSLIKSPAYKEKWYNIVNTWRR
jgi:GWxTD domain-containing protein